MKLYSGCPDKYLKAYLDMIELDTRALKAKNSEAHCTYSPMEEKYHVHIWGKPVSGYHEYRHDAIIEALRVL